jgi:hypothetical protein
MLSVIALNVIMPSATTLNVIMLSVIRLNVIMLSVVAPSKIAGKHFFLCVLRLIGFVFPLLYFSFAALDKTTGSLSTVLQKILQL